jgi:hypothetical protein
MERYELKRRAARTWAFIDDKKTRRHYQQQWIKAVNILGNRWLAAPTVERKEQS